MNHIRYNIQGVNLRVFYEIENGDVHFDDVTFEDASIFDVVEALRPDLWNEFEARILEEVV
jgi:hypothetical protein